MKLAFLSNFMNHHQLPFAQRLYALLGEDYKFIALEELPEERRAMGYADMNHEYPFVICAYDSTETQAAADKFAFECDLLIAGSCPDYYIRRRTDRGKAVIKISERYFKKARTLGDAVQSYLSAKKHLAHFQNCSLYFLCASAYTAADVNKYTKFPDRTYKWGYFPEVKRYDDIGAVIERKRPASILWVARLIELKHPELPVMIAKRLKEDGCTFELNIIGNGEQKEKIQRMICAYHVDDCVHMLGAMSPGKVRENMEQSEIFLFTSDRNEGWGAVLNESMNSGCAVIASHAIGSVPFLIRDRENGLIYQDADTGDLYRKTKWLLEHPVQRRRLGLNAYLTMAEEWNADNAAKRFLLLAEKILSGQTHPTVAQQGVCSKAEILKDDWYRKTDDDQ